MNKQVNICVLPEQAANDDFLRRMVARELEIGASEITSLRIVRRSVDARQKTIKMDLSIDVWVGESEPELNPKFEYPNVSLQPEIVIVGAGPAGLFAALRLIELGLKPIIVERGKDVSRRKRDIAAIHRNEGVNPDSNYGFGEGGAGTFSDGKLFTRSKKRGNSNKILEVFVFHGAQPEILVEAHPHIGTNVLPRVVSNMRQTILNSGGEIIFDKRMTSINIEFGRVAGVVLSDGTTIKSRAVILATGHSARDVYYMLHNQGIVIEAKDFAVGVRLEHPQQLIDSIRYKRSQRGEFLPPATYSFVEQVEGRGVYSFCMCPGGMIVPAATAANEHVVNGMSPSMRNGHFANSGYVVETRIGDLNQYSQYGELAGLKFQEEIEHLAFSMANHSMIAPAQRVTDFVAGRNSSSLADTSYHPGISSSDMYRWIPEFVADRLRKGLKMIDRKSPGILTAEASVIGIESRTSSPVRIPRNADTLEHVTVAGLYPCGEGAGYAGGIVSSAVDGERCAEMVAKAILQV